MSRLPRVVVPVSLSNRYLRALYRGVAESARLQARPFEPLLADPGAIGSLRPKPDGVIAFSGVADDWTALRELGVPLVNCSGRMEIPGVPSVTGDALAEGRLAGEHLRECGFRHFGFYGHGPLMGRVFVRRREGFEEAVRKTALTFSVHLCNPRGASARPRARERRRLQEWMKRLPRPVGILCSTDWDAWDVYDACEALGLEIGVDVGLVGVDNDDFYCESRRPALSSVENRSDRIGAEAAALMARLLRGERPPPGPILVAPFGVVTRASTDMVAGGDTHVTAAVRFIRDHPDRPLDAGAVVGASPLSRRALERRFRRLLGRSILQEIHRAKLQRIRQLLADTDHTIDEIAGHCGFVNASHMTALFRHESGTTPRAWRRRFRDRRAGA